MPKSIKKIVIVGGGTAGWMVASRLSAKHQASPESKIEITLVESENIKPIGVGEGTWPTMRDTLRQMGISETDFIRECDATFKQGAKFSRWRTGAEDDFYYHPLVLPQDFIKTNLVPFWQKYSQEESFSNAVNPQEQICEMGLGPKQITTPEFAAVANYAYHLNAAKFSEFLKKHCVNKHRVNHVVDDVIKVNPTECGDIASVSTKMNGDIEGDLFVDCSGFACILLGEHYKVPFIEKLDTLFVDTALAVQVPYESEDSPILTVTGSTATSAGWIWDIGTIDRRGIGHVYSSRHTSEAEAEAELMQYLGDSGKNVEINKIPVRPGHRDHPWERNCVAIGLSAGFLEPLEASALVQVELSAAWLADQLPSTRESMSIISKRFNDAFKYRWGRIIDFLKLHYVLSQRTDNDFWIENRDPASIPESLQECMALWKHQYPWHHDFDRSNEMFPAASYQYILSGMGFMTEAPYTPSEYELEMARKHYMDNKKKTKTYLDNLPKHRELLRQIHEQGLAPL